MQSVKQGTTGVALAQVHKQLANLHGNYRRHCAEGELSHGYFAALCTAAPRYLTMVKPLRADRVRLMRAIEAVRLRAAAAREDQLASVLREATALTAAVERHIEFETELLMDAVLQG